MSPLAAAVATSAAAALLFGCAHGVTRPASQCSAMLEAGGIRAISHSLLNRAGAVLSSRDEWMRGFAPRPRDFHQTVWERTGPADRPVDGVVTLRFHPVTVAEPFRIELRSGSPGGPVLASGHLAKLAATPQLVTSWSAMNHWLGAGPLYLAAADRQGQVLDSLRVDAAIYNQGLAMVRTTSAEVRAKAADYRQRCQVHQEIIVT